MTDLRNKTILQIIPSLETGGAERGCIDVAAAVVAAGGRAIVVSEGGRLVPELERAGATHMIRPVARKNPLAIWRNTKWLAHFIRQEKVTLVHARSRAPAWSAYRAARQCGVPFVTTFHAPYNAQNRLKRAYNSVMTRGDKIISVSDYVTRHIIETYGVAPERIVTIPRGIDLDVFDPARLGRDRMARLAAQWALPDDKHIALLPARLTRWKGHTIFIEALAILESKFGRSDVFGVLVGDAQGRESYVRELNQMVSSRGLESRVRMPGGCGDMAAAYALASVIVSPAIEPEAFGRVIVEAQAMERPVVVSDVGACRETVRDGETGWIVPKGDAGALAEALHRAFGLSPDARGAIGRAGRAYVIERYTKAAMCASTLDVYNRLARTNP